MSRIDLSPEAQYRELAEWRKLRMQTEGVKIGLLVVILIAVVVGGA